MSASLRTPSAVAVLLSGLLVLTGVHFGGAEPAEPEPIVATSPPTLPAPALPAVDGLDPAVARVLAAAGKLEALGVEQLGIFPPEVARVLTSRGAPLLVPEPAGGAK